MVKVLFASVPKSTEEMDLYAPRWVISEAITVWIEETKKVLTSIPKGALKLVFYSEDPFEHTRETECLFRTLLQDAAWQTALERCQKRGMIAELNPSRHLSSTPLRLERFAGQAPRPCHFSASFPSDIVGSLDEHSFFRFHSLDLKRDTGWVDPDCLSKWADGEACNVEQIILDNQHCQTAEDWGDKWWRLAYSDASSTLLSSRLGWEYVLKEYNPRCY